MEARLEYPITLHMMGDWGIANLHRICGWIGAELWRRSPAGSKFATWAGRGGTDAITRATELSGVMYQRCSPRNRRGVRPSPAR